MKGIVGKIAQSRVANSDHLRNFFPGFVKWFQIIKGQFWGDKGMVVYLKFVKREKEGFIAG